MENSRDCPHPLITPFTIFGQKRNCTIRATCEMFTKCDDRLTDGIRKKYTHRLRRVHKNRKIDIELYLILHRILEALGKCANI